MADVNANIRVDLDAAQALAQLKALEKQIQYFNKNIIQGTAEASKVQSDFSSSLIHNINATGKFTASMGKVMTETERFTNALEKNKLSAREYFRYSMASTKTFGRMFGKEFGVISKVAEERVKLLQTRHIELGRAADGAMRAVKVVPNALDYSKPITQMQLAIQKQQIFNQLLDSGTTKLLNFGKNTQWAGRQLMVGFTIPLSILGGTAIKTFRDMETQAIRFKKVYGDMFTATAETDAALENIKVLAREFTKYGVTVADTIRLAADAAAAGSAGEELENVVTQATKLSVLGGVAQEQAFDATIAIQNAFRVTGKELDETINFLNAVENQTVLALEDITEAIPKVAPVIQQLGGDVKDLAFFMTAMKEGGVSASEGANALKSGLARLINPTKAASEYAADLGINLKGIVEQNAGDLRTTMLTFSEAIKPLEDLERSRLLEKVFGKYQFARISTLFDNLGRSGNQAARVLDLTAASTEELAIMAERELGITADSAATKLTASIENLKAALVPLGETFARILTPVAEFLTKVLDRFNNFSDGTKKAITIVLAVLGGIGPVLLMTVGLVANGIANILKFINLLRKGYQNLANGGNNLGLTTNYLTQEQLEALSVANNLHMAHELLTDQFALEAGALTRLTSVYQQATAAAGQFARTNPAFFQPGARGNIAKFGKPMAEGGWVPGTGNKDTVPTVLMPGEFVVKKDVAQSNKALLENMNKGGGTYRTKGTPAFKNFEYRSDGSLSRAHLGISTDLSVQDLQRMLDDKKNRPIRGSSQSLIEEAIRKNTGLVGYTNEVVGLPFDVQNAMGPGKRGSLGSIISQSITQDPEAFSFGFLEYVLDSVSDEELPIQSKKQILENIAEDVVNELNQNPDKLYNDVDLQDVVRRAEDKQIRRVNNPAVRSKLRNTANEYRTTISTLGIPEARGGRGERQGIYSTRRISKFSPLRSYKDKKLSAIHERIMSRFGRFRGLGASGAIPASQSPRVATPSTSRSRSSSPGRLIYGAAAGVMGRNARATFAKGSTSQYGETSVTPALLTPGEFVMNSQSTQANGPMLQAMNAGGFVKRVLGTPSQKAQMVAQMKIDDPTLTSKEALRQMNKFEKAMSKTTDQLNVMGKTTEKQNKMARQSNMMNRMGTFSMLGFAMSGGAMALSQVEGPVGEFANKLMPATMALSTIAGLLPLLSNPLVLGAAAVGGLVASVVLLNKSVDTARKKGFELGQQMGNTSDDLKKMSEITGKVAASDIAARQRSERVRAINPLRSDFGQEFIGTEIGKAMLKEVQESGGNTAKMIGTKLADYVSQGLLDASQAQSIAEEIGRQFGGSTYAMNITGQLESLIGVNGQDLFRDPIEVRVRLIEEAQGGMESFINTIPAEIQKIQSESITTGEGGLFFNPIAFGKELKRFATTGQADWAQLGDFLLGSSFKDKQGFAALGGQLAGNAKLALEASTKAIDAFDVQMQKRKIEYQETQKILEAELKIAENAEKRQKIEERLISLKRAQNSLEQQTARGREELIAKQQEVFNQIQQAFAGAGELQVDMQKAVNESISAQYKDTPLAPIIELLLGQTKDLEKNLQFNITSLLSSGSLDPQNVLSLLNVFVDPATGKPNEVQIQKQLDLMFEAHGFDGMNRALTSTSEMLDNVQRSNTITYLRKLDGEAFNAANSLLEMATGMNNLDVNMTEFSSNMSADKMASIVEAGEDLAKIEAEIPDKITKEALIEFAQSDEDFMALETNVDWFESLPDEQTKYAIQVFRTVLETIDLSKVRTDLENQQKALQSSSLVQGMSVGGPITDEQVYAEASRRAIEITKRYFGPDSKFADVLNDPTEGEGGGGGTLPITTAQLIELRMKGLDPMAASNLDAASAAEILNGTVKQQRNAIANLNMELRNNAIRSELLKSDQEVLNDTLKITSETIGAYVDMLEQTSIKPIQNQIDKYNELTETQQRQIEKYQKGIQDLSSKEDAVNKAYDERISAIDKVSQANERAAQKQQQQLDLASALASGDFAAAAAAQADITASEAAYQLEDTRAALEEARQQELNNLAVEINGKLYTREQIENNIKTIEEEIYQRTLMVRQEQEKIAAIEKQITAEKERQRQLQVLQQMSQLSQQISTTVDPTQRQLMGQQLGLLGQSIGITNVTDQSQFNALGQQLGVNLQGITTTFATALKTSEMTSKEFADTYSKVAENTGNISRFMKQGSVQAGLALGYMTNVASSWGDKNNGIRVQGYTIQNSLIGASESIKLGKRQIDEAVGKAIAAINAAAISRKDRKMYGGKIVKMAMGGNINYKGSNEPAPVRMAMGSIVPGLGNTDRVPALLTPGEFVVRKSVAQANMPFLQALNGDVFPTMGGGVADINPASVNTTSVVTNNTPVYNSYSINVNVPNTNASPEEIASVVASRLNRLSGTGIRGGRRIG